MSSHLRISASALIVTGALALPAAASADVTTAVKAVQVHTDRADTALDRAVSLFARGNDRPARIAYARSRKEMGLATAAAATARRQADTGDEQAQAAFAQALLGVEQGQNVEKLAAALLKSDGADQNKIAAAARTDTKGRDKSIAILTVLLGEVPEQAKTGIARAIAALAQDRDDETRAEVKALVSSKVSDANKRRTAATIKASIDGQDKAADTLAALIASPDMPAESRQGLQTAYDAVTAEHGSVADILSRLSDRMPAFVRAFVKKIVTQARTDAQGMRENHPTGPPAGTPGGRPAGTPGGPPSGTPSGPPSGTPSGAPSGAPSGPPVSIPIDPPVPAGLPAGP